LTEQQIANIITQEDASNKHSNLMIDYLENINKRQPKKQTEQQEQLKNLLNIHKEKPKTKYRTS
jgi:hypothetical protein